MWKDYSIPFIACQFDLSESPECITPTTIIPNFRQPQALMPCLFPAWRTERTRDAKQGLTSNRAYGII